MSWIEVFKEYEEGLKDIEGFCHIVVLWIIHESGGYSLLVEPLAYKGDVRGVFATAHHDRPKNIGLMVVELLQRKGNMLRFWRDRHGGRFSCGGHQTVRPKVSDRGY